MVQHVPNSRFPNQILAQALSENALHETSIYLLGSINYFLLVNHTENFDGNLNVNGGLSSCIDMRNLLHAHFDFCIAILC